MQGVVEQEDRVPDGVEVILAPAEELKLLEQEARDLGISEDELNQIRAIGGCPQQVQARITLLHQFCKAHEE